MDALKHDKKKTGKNLNFILPEKTGRVTVVKDVTQDEVEGAAVLEELRLAGMDESEPVFSSGR